MHQYYDASGKRRSCDTFAMRRSCDTFVQRRKCDSLKMSEERQYENVGRAMLKTSDHISSELRQFTNVGRVTVWETSEE